MTLMNWPADLERSDQPDPGWEFMIPVSAARLCVRALDPVLPGRTVKMKVSLPKGAEYESFRVETEVAWKKGHFREGWEEYHYAWRFVEMINRYYLKIGQHLCRRFWRGEAFTRIGSRGASL